MNRLYIGNLPLDTTELSLIDLLSLHDLQFQNVALRENAGYAFIDCPDQSAADRVVDCLNGINFQGSTLVVEPSFNKPQRKSDFRSNDIAAAAAVAAAAAAAYPQQYWCNQGIATANNILFGTTATTNNSYSPSVINTMPSRISNGQSSSRKIIVSQLPNHCRYEDLEPMLIVHGTIQHCEKLQSHDPNTQTVQITYDTPEQARQAAMSLNNAVLDDVQIRAKVASDRRTNSGRKMNAGNYSSGSGNGGGGGNGSMGMLGGNGNGGGAGAGSVQQQAQLVSGAAAPSVRQTDFPLRILVQSEMVGAIIGKQGTTIRQITQQTRARVDVHRRDSIGTMEKAITIYGHPENCTNACKRILDVMQKEALNTNKGEIVLKILAHNSLIGRIIGKGGNTIKKIMTDTDTRISVSSINDVNSYNIERIISVRGLLDNMSKAEALISAKLKASYEKDVQSMTGPASMMFPPFNPLAMMASMPPLAPPPPPPPPPQSMNYGSGRGAAGMYAAATGAGHLQFPNIYPAAAGHLHSGAAGLCSAAAGGGDSTETTFLYIPNSMVGAIIGTKGSCIRSIMRYSGASVKIASTDSSSNSAANAPSSVAATAGSGDVTSELSSSETDASAAGAAQSAKMMAGSKHGMAFSSGANVPSERRVTIIGNLDAQWKAQYMFFEKMREEGFSNGADDVRLTTEIFVPSSQVGRIIGKGGQNVRDLQRVTGSVIKLPDQSMVPSHGDDETVVHIIGSFYSVQSAQRRIRSMIAQAILSQNRPPRSSRRDSSNQQQQQQPQQSQQPQQQTSSSSSSLQQQQQQQQQQEQPEQQSSQPQSQQ